MCCKNLKMCVALVVNAMFTSARTREFWIFEEVVEGIYILNQIYASVVV